MPSSWTPLDFELQAAGENNNTWGQDHLNNVISRIGDAFGGYLSIAISGDYTLTTVRPTTSMVPADFSGRIALLKFTGSPPANATITVPAAAMSRSIWNATNKVQTFTTGAGATVTIDPGDKNITWCDGSGVHQITFGGLGLKDYIAAAALGTVGDLPAQTGNAGKYVRTDGTNATWQFVDALASPTVTGSFKATAVAVAVSAVDVSQSEFQTKSISTNTTFTFTGATASAAQGFILVLTISSAAVPTWPASVDWSGGSPPTLPNGTHWLGFLTIDGGTNWTGFVGAVAVA